MYEQVMLLLKCLVLNKKKAVFFPTQLVSLVFFREQELLNLQRGNT